MDVYLGIRWNGTIDDGLRAHLLTIPHVECTEEHTTIRGLRSTDWRYVIRKCKEHGLELFNPATYFFALLPNDAGMDLGDTDPADVVAYIIRGSEQRNQILNGPSDRQFELPSPCQAPVLFDVAIDLKYNPKGGVEELPSCELIVSRQFLQAIDARPNDFVARIRCKGVTLSNWFRPNETEKIPFLAPESYSPVIACAICGNSYVGRKGVWIAKDSAALSASYAFDALGIYHYQSIFTLLASRDTIRCLQGRRRQFDCSIEPVFSNDSPISVLVRDCITEITSGDKDDTAV